MNALFLALALVAPVSPASDEDRWDSDEPVSCSVSVHALDDAGRPRPSRRVSASVAPAVVFRGKVSRQDDELPPLVFDVFNPRGQRYQVLLATPVVIAKQRGGLRVERVSRVRGAALGVAGSSIAWTSMFGKWRVEPRLEGRDKPCGRAEYFTIRP